MNKKTFALKFFITLNVIYAFLVAIVFAFWVYSTYKVLVVFLSGVEEAGIGVVEMLVIDAFFALVGYYILRTAIKLARPGQKTIIKHILSVSILEILISLSFIFIFSIAANKAILISSVSGVQNSSILRFDIAIGLMIGLMIGAICQIIYFYFNKFKSNFLDQ